VGGRGGEKAKGTGKGPSKSLRGSFEELGKAGWETIVPREREREMKFPLFFFFFLFFSGKRAPPGLPHGLSAHADICYYAESVSFLSLHISVKMEDGEK